MPKYGNEQQRRRALERRRANYEPGAAVQEVGITKLGLRMQKQNGSGQSELAGYLNFQNGIIFNNSGCKISARVVFNFFHFSFFFSCVWRAGMSYWIAALLNKCV